MNTKFWRNVMFTIMGIITVMGAFYPLLVWITKGLVNKFKIITMYDDAFLIISGVGIIVTFIYTFLRYGEFKEAGINIF